MLKGIPSDDDTDQDDEAEDRLEVLSANLVDLREYIGCNVEVYGEPVHSGVFKLSDYVDIEICRIRDRDNIFHELSRTGDNIVSLSKQATELKKDLSKQAAELKKELDEARDKADKLQMHTVAILGIFAAIVMAFAGGLDILSGAISVSGESDLFKVVFVVLLCGMVLFNIFAFLMHMILAIINPQSGCDPRRYQGTDRKSKKARLSVWLDRFVGSRFIIAFNAALLMAMVIDAILMIVLA